MSRGRGLALGAAALVLGALFLALILRRQERGALVRVAEDAAPSARPAEDLGSVAPAPAESGADEPAAEARVVLEPRTSEAGVREGIRVRVVRAADRQAVPGAEVLWFDSGSVDSLAHEELLASDDSVETTVEHFGRRFRTDRSGIAVVPFVHASGFVCAAHEGGWAQAWIEPLTDEVELVLQPDQAIVVRLDGGSGVSTSGEVIELRQRLLDGSHFTDRHNTTDGDGRARFEHLQSIRPGVDDIAFTYFVGARVLAAEPVQVALDPAHWPSEEIVLHLPATGAVHVELVGPKGEPRGGEGKAELELARDTVARLRDAGLEIPVRSTSQAIREGRARFERVGLGLELELFAHADGWKQHLATVSGPTRAGETVVARVPLTDTAPSIHGRIVDRDGRPLAGESLTCVLWSQGEQEKEIEQRRTDDSGRFAGFGGPYLFADSAWLLLFSIPGEPQRAARFTLDAPTVAGPIDLGDIVLDLAPLLVRGTVVDESGRPVRAARLLFEEWTEGPSRPGLFGWSPLPRGDVASAPEGSFELRGWTRGERLRISVRRPGYEPFASLVLPPPADDVRIVLRREGSIAGRMLTGRGRAQKLAHLSVHEERGGHHGRGITWGSDGAFRIGGLPAGTYTLVLSLWNHYPGSRAWPGIVVRSGETAEIGDIALDEFVTLLRFELREPSGAAIPDVLIRWSILGGEHLASGVLQRDSNGTHLLPTLELPLSVELEAPGFRPARLEDVRTNQRVVLTRGPHVQLVLGGLPRLGEHWSLWARLERGEATEASAAFDTNGRTSLYVTHSGPFRVGLWLQHGGETGFKSLEGLGWRIEVADSPEAQTFFSPAPTAEFLDNLARLTR